MRLVYSAQAVCVALCTVAWSALLFATTYYHRSRLSPKTSKLALPLASLACSCAFVITAGLLVREYATPGTPLVSPFSGRWFSIGWNRSLVFMGVVCDSPVAYGLIINYQITRCIIGSLLSNAFLPYVVALQGTLLFQNEKDMHKLLFARACTDVYGFVSSLTDLILYVSQIDIFFISCIATIATNYVSTWLLLQSADSDARLLGRKELLSGLEKPQTQALYTAVGAPQRLRL